ncbi:hypothetical protein EXIGLDRAFT_109410 [Exidia glandulosa HHB12029]|uniref:Uncharacterized protein n=1 Tax=Exidia glandulosa HHB12029 TaxID=1314781 RepID=A0A165GQC9_EXIGL|nr:hypothetical protein EXIGLDRAFT_109410 [Exidia glandulosa HHB12029]
MRRKLVMAAKPGHVETTTVQQRKRQVSARTKSRSPNSTVRARGAARTRPWNQAGFCGTAISTNRRRLARRARRVTIATGVVKGMPASLLRAKLCKTETTGEVSLPRGEKRAYAGRHETGPQTAGKRSEIMTDALSYGLVEMGASEARRSQVGCTADARGKQTSHCDGRASSADFRRSNQRIRGRQTRWRSPFECPRRCRGRKSLGRPTGADGRGHRNLDRANEAKDYNGVDEFRESYGATVWGENDGTSVERVTVWMRGKTRQRHLEHAEWHDGRGAQLGIRGRGIRR